MPARRPWTFAAVCVMVVALTLLVFGLSQVPVIAAARLRHRLPPDRGLYLRPTRKEPSWRQAIAFLLPGTLLVFLALLDIGSWCGGWLLGLPAWGPLLSRRTPENPLPAVQVMKFLGLLVLGMTIYTFNIIWVIFSLGPFLLPIIPLVRLAYPGYRAKPLQAATEVLLAVAALVVAFATPTPEGSWSSPWIYAGGAATAGLIIAWWARGLPRRSQGARLNEGAVV